MYRRSYKRFSANTPVALKKNGASEENCMLRDISARGIGIFGSLPHEIDEKVMVNFQLPFLFDEQVSKQARISWTTKVNEKFWISGLDFGLDNMLNLVNKPILPTS